MKWIKYQILQSAIGEEIVLANKKVGYSNENLAIAQKEAYNGYEIIDDSQSFEKEPLGIEVGGTGAKDAATARQKLGITPKNIGALSLDGSQAMTGDLTLGPNSGTTDGRYLNINRLVDSNIFKARMFVNGEHGAATVQLMKNDSVKNRMMLHEDRSEFTKPLVVSSGGHGGSTPEQARQNLGIIPENIGAVKESEYYGSIKKEGPICQAKCYEGTGIHVVTEFSPKQAGSGDPYPAGGGKNLLENTAITRNIYGITYTVNDDGSITANGTATNESYFPINTKTALPVGTYIMTGCKSNSYGYYLVDYVHTPSGEYIRAFVDSGLSITIEVADATAQHGFQIYIPNGVTVSNVTFFPMLRLASDADATYEPYSNIRPITGYDALNLNAAGVNLAPTHKNFPATSTGITVSESGGVLTVSGTTNTTVRMDSDLIELLPGTYTLKPNHSATLNASIYMRRPDKTKFGSVSLANSINAKSTFTITEPEKVTVSLFFEQGAIAENISFAVMLNVGSEPAAFEPYQGKLHTVQIGQTVYGGKFDWLTGKLVAEWAMYQPTSGSTWYVEVKDNGVTRATQRKTVDVEIQGAGGFFSHGIYLELWADNRPHAYIGNGAFSMTMPTSVIGTTSESINAYIDAQSAVGTPMQIAYKLANPIEIQLDKIGAIEALNGINTIYSNADNCIVEFGHPMVKSEFVTTEEPTGQVWIDGKPIYRRVFTISGEYGSFESNSVYSVIQVGNISPLETVVNFYGTVVNHFGGKPSAHYPISAGARPSQTNDNAFVGGQIFNGGDVTLYVQGVQIHSGHVVVEYTKADE